MSTKYPIGIQNFEKLRKDGYLYIDKTALMYQLVDRGSYYFLSRPRLSERLNVSPEDAFDIFYESDTCRRFHDPVTGLY